MARLWIWRWMLLLCGVFVVLLLPSHALDVCVDCGSVEPIFAISASSTHEDWTPNDSGDLYEIGGLEARTQFLVIPFPGEEWGPISVTYEEVMHPADATQAGDGSVDEEAERQRQAQRVKDAGEDPVLRDNAIEEDKHLPLMLPRVLGPASHGFSWHANSETKVGHGLALDVYYFCQRPGLAEVTVSVPLRSANPVGPHIPSIEGTTQSKHGSDQPLDESNVVSFVFRKDCGKRGKREGFMVSSRPSSSDEEWQGDVVRDGHTQEHWMFGDEEVGSSEEVRHFWLWIGEMLGSQAYAAPAVTTSEPWLHASLRNEASQGSILVEGYAEQLTVLFQCDASAQGGTAVVEISVSIVPFDPLTWAFKKKCPTGFRQHLQVVMSGNKVLVENGQAVEQPSILILPHQTTSSSFSLRMEQKTVQAHGAPIVTVSDSNVLYVALSGEASDAGFLEQREHALRAYYSCRDKGEASVTITIPVTGYQPVEWAFVKKCDHASSPHVESYYWTANQVMVLLVILLGLVAGALYHWYSKHLRSKKKVPVIPLTMDD